MAEEPRARVFISCGQQEGEERAIAGKIANVLHYLGFEPYVATQEQTLKGLRDNIFWHLEYSEYFLFIDFKREQLANSDDFRGSLFSHQELGIASFLDLDAIIFQESGVKETDGLMRYLQTNAEVFEDRDDLPMAVKQKIQKAAWRSGWRNELSLEMCDPPYTEARDVQNYVMSRFFHLRVRNLHDRKPALNCVATVESIVRGPTVQKDDLRRVELRWAGSSVPQALIPSGGARELDLGFVPLQDCSVFMFNSFTTGTQYLPPLRGAGEHIVTYLIASATFPPSKFTARIRLGDLFKDNIDDVWVERAS